jgi:hypothetical protein
MMNAYDQYVDKSADALAIAKMDLDVLEAQIADMDPDLEDPRDSALAVHIEAVQIVAEQVADAAYADPDEVFDWLREPSNIEGWTDLSAQDIADIVDEWSNFEQAGE